MKEVNKNKLLEVAGFKDPQAVAFDGYFGVDWDKVAKSIHSNYLELKEENERLVGGIGGGETGLIEILKGRIKKLESEIEELDGKLFSLSVNKSLDDMKKKAEKGKICKLCYGEINEQ